jgi:LmbE family N-acetylglucosaminyl deacetylase
MRVRDSERISMQASLVAGVRGFSPDCCARARRNSRGTPTLQAAWLRVDDNTRLQAWQVSGINIPMDWIYLSPHPDDVALSCGGLLWEQAEAGDQPQVWTICAGDPPPGPVSDFAAALQSRWETGPIASQQRRQEDIQSCRLLRSAYRHFPLPDCIYRRDDKDHIFLYTSEESLFGPLDEREAGLVERLTAELAGALPKGAQLVCPLSVGGHVDHRLTRLAAERLGEACWYYADFPYILNDSDQLARFTQTVWGETWFPISAAGMQAWEAAVAAHRSQISTFWPDLAALQAALRAYARQEDGSLQVRLWRASPPAPEYT